VKLIQSSYLKNGCQPDFLREGIFEKEEPVIRIDHAIMATAQLEKTTRRLREQYGLGCLQGGLHPDGTRTWVIPLGSKYVNYIEILTVEDVERARKDFFGRWLLERIEEGESFVGWALQTDEIDAICARLNLLPEDGGVARPDGWRTSWTEAGFEQAGTSGWLPFFISYHNVDARRERARADLLQVQHAIEPIEISWISVGGNQQQLQQWMGSSTLPVRVVDAQPPGVQAVGIRTTQGEIIVK